MATLKGGNITSSIASHIIRKLSIRYEQTAEKKRYINSTVTNTGHGSIFLGSSSRMEGGDRTIRILVGAHFARYGKLKIGVFGGKCEQDEMTLDTVIRETIEEIFNFKVSAKIIYYIRNFLNENPDFYFIYQISDKTRAYSYFFDVSILSDFIRIISDTPALKKMNYFIPSKDGLSNVENFLQTNISMKDRSSFDGPFSEGIESTIKLIEFMRARYISFRLKELYKKIGIYTEPGMDEVKYLSFVTLSKLLAAVPEGCYKLFNFPNNKRDEELQMQELLIKILKKEVINEILSFQ